jgi:hypothetical protein
MHATILAHLKLIHLVTMPIRSHTTSCLYSPNILLGTPSLHSAPQFFSQDKGPSVTAERNQQGVIYYYLL